jgi:hypothetical protein
MLSFSDAGPIEGLTPGTGAGVRKAAEDETVKLEPRNLENIYQGRF